MADLSPAAQAVLDAFLGNPEYREELEDDRHYLAAALRVAADQVVPKDDDPSGEWTTKDEIRYNLLAIATELEGTNG